MQGLWVETVTFFQNIWTKFTAGLLQGWNRAQQVLTKGWLELMGMFDRGLDVKAARRQVDIETHEEKTRIETEICSEAISD